MPYPAGKAVLSFDQKAAEMRKNEKLHHRLPAVEHNYASADPFASCAAKGSRVKRTVFRIRI